MTPTPPDSESSPITITMSDDAAAGSAGQPLIGVAALARRASDGAHLVPLGQELLQRALADPADANACIDLSTVLLLTGNRDHALAVQQQAIAQQALYVLPATRPGRGLRLLAVMGPGDLMANTPVGFLVEDSDVTLQMLYLAADAAWPESLPEHDVMLVAVGESDTSQALLQRLAAWVGRCPRTVINDPARIAELSRDRVSERLQGIPGLVMPLAARVGRAQLLALAEDRLPLASLLADAGFPLIIRPLGSHAGIGLEKLDDADALLDYLQRIDDDGFFISGYVDYRSGDGQFRKYRIALVDGRPFLSHMAISAHWIIHYANAGMKDCATKRAEEAACMANFDVDFAYRHAAALQAIDQRVGLDYLIIDCAETATGELLVFEVDNSAVVHATDPVDVFPYKQPAMHKLFVAFRDMLERARPAAG